jgi:phospholipid/cholesterol/gamma-HCH transport system ATP-binding protein
MAVSNQSVVVVKDVRKAFGERVVLDNVNLTVHDDEILAIIGPSGCGKSTLLRVISGLDSPDTGEVTLADDNLTLVFQYSALFDSLTVFENVAFSLMETPDLGKQKERKQYTYRELRKLVREKLRLVGLEGVDDMYPNELSGGMQKRVSFARAIVSDPKIILYDEPTAGLDPIASTMLENYILKLRDEIGATSIVVTHHLSTIRRVADRVCLLFDGEIQWQGTVDELFTTDNPYARQFAHASLEGPMATTRL